jgi:serine/threonine protein kinase
LSTSVIEPGTRLAGRFRLDDRVSEAGGSTFWKATDEILARPVAVLTFAPGFPRVHDVVTAARAASRLTDPRLTQVFDADDSGERAYVVSEWVTGETLEDLLTEGPMEADRAAAFLLEASEALTSAHSAGLAHLCLTPHNLVWTSGGTVKVTGLGVEAVLSGMTSDSPASDDTQGLAHMLYAALTGHWCGTEGTQLPLAPTGGDGRALPPSQVRPGVPQNLDLIACRALHLPLHGAEEPLSTPSAFADALAQVPRSPLPFVPLVGSTPPAVVPRPDSAASSTSTSPVDSPTRTVPDASPSTRRATSPARHSADREGGVSRPVMAALAVGLLIIVGLGGWGISKMGATGGDSPSKAGTKTGPAGQPDPKKLSPQGAKGFDPSPGDHPDLSLPKAPGKAIDGSDGSFWGTQHYLDPHYGRYKKGLGLMLDMGHPVNIDRIEVTMPQATEQGTVQLQVGDSQDANMRQTDTGPASGTFTLKGGKAKGQYVLLWFTKLPKVGLYQIKVNNVAVYGSG